jgi:hypothetical protein
VPCQGKISRQGWKVHKLEARKQEEEVVHVLSSLVYFVMIRWFVLVIFSEMDSDEFLTSSASSRHTDECWEPSPSISQQDSQPMVISILLHNKVLTNLSPKSDVPTVLYLKICS